MGDVLLSLAEVADFVITLVWYAIIIRVLLSWIIRPNPYAPPNPVVRFFSAVTDPLLLPLRRILPRLGPLDISPFVAILILMFVRIYIRRALHTGF